MIPALATIISAYVVFRMAEVFCFPRTRYLNKGAWVVMLVFAAIVILVVGFNLMSILSAGSQQLPSSP